MKKVILALSFGKPAGIIPNMFIANLAISLSQKKYSIVADRSVPLKTFLPIGKEAEVHVSTLNLIREFVELLKEKGWSEIIIVSEPSYLVRCERDLKKVLGGNVRKYTISLFVFADNGDIWFDRHSTQWWIRSRRLFHLRETLIMALPWWIYKRIS